MVSLHGGGFGGDGDDIRAAREEKSLDLGGGAVADMRREREGCEGPA